jgi:hypothetical protein
VDDEAYKFGSSMYFETCFEMEWFGTQKYFPYSTFVATIINSLTFKLIFFVWTLCYHYCFIVMCHGFLIFLLKNFMVSISIKSIFNLHIRNLTLKKPQVHLELAFEDVNLLWWKKLFPRLFSYYFHHM